MIKVKVSLEIQLVFFHHLRFLFNFCIPALILIKLQFC